MTNAQQIEQFIRDEFDIFGFNYRDIIGVEETDDEQFADAPIAIGNELDMINVEKAAEALGVTSDLLIAMDSNALRTQREKYPFFDFGNGLELEYRSTFFAPGYKTARLMDAIFRDDFKASDQYPVRYDRKDVEHRLEELLLRYNETLPGTYHYGAKITNLQISTRNFCHYQHIKDMCWQFLDIVDRVRELFFKALDGELTQEEINEYNISVTITGLTDAVLPTRGYLYYSVLRKRRHVYKSEHFDDFFSYARLSRHRFFYPYRCVEFVKDRELVQRFTSIYPHMKQAMREYALDVTKFKCFFVWSDAKPVVFSPEEKNLMELEFGKLPLDNRAKEPTEVYVPKTNEELNGDEDVAELLRVLSGPETLGGVKAAGFSYALKIDPTRITARLYADRGDAHE